MQIIGFVVFLFLSHLVAMQIFRLTTYHVWFWKALPLLVAYGSAVGWTLFALGMHRFFLWQLVLASVWLSIVARQQSNMAKAILAAAGDDAELIRQAASSSAKTGSYYAYSSFVYIAAFAITYIFLYNS